MFYSPSTRGFYDRSIHGDNIPEDVVEITDEMHEFLIAGQSSGKRISSDDSGFPILVDAPPAPPAPAPLDSVQKFRAFLDANPDFAALIGQ